MKGVLRFQLNNKQSTWRLSIRLVALTIGLLANCLLQSASAQTTLIDPAGAGGFELGNTFAANGWTVNNTTPVAPINKWFVGNVPTGFTGNSAYISNNATGTTHAYAPASNSLVHFYRDVTFPAGETNITLSFQWKGAGELSAYDGLQVSLAPTSTTPTTSITTGASVVSAPLVTGATVLGSILYFNQTTVQTVTLTIPASLAGNCSSASTMRLIFSWRNDDSAGSGIPSAVDNISLTSAPILPLASSGPFTINNTLATGGTNFATFTAAINWLNSANTCPFTTPIVFNVSAGQTFSENPPAITASGTAANTITFQKAGAGANPVITPTGTTATTDFGIAITGGDYITFNAIDITAPAAVEYGYLVRNASATNGAQNNTIGNMALTMNTTGSNLVYGIFQTASTTGGGLAPTAATGANSTNRYLNFTITGAKGAGVYLLGNSSFPDQNCEIGTTSCTAANTISAVTTISGTAAAGIRATSQFGVKIYNNIIQSVTASSTLTLDGIWLDNSGSTTVSVGTCEIYSNRVLGVSNTSTSAGVTGGIRVNLTGNATSVSRVYNNWVTGLENASTTAGTRSIVGIRVQEAASGSGATHNIDFNNVRIDPTNLATSNACLATGTGSGPVIRVRNNVLANFTGAQTGSAKHYIVAVTGTTTVGPAGSTWNYNDYYLANTTNGFIGIGSSTDYATLAAWQAGPGQSPAGTDANTIQVNPGYTSATDLHVSNPTLNAAAAPTAPSNSPWVTVDNECEPRPQPVASNYDIGADEIFVAGCTGTPTAGSISTPTNPICVGQSAVLTLTGASSGAGISYQWRSSTTPGGPYTPISGAINSTYTATNVTTTTYYVVNVTCSAGPTTVTTAEFTLTVNPLPTASVTPSSATACSWW